MIKRIGILLFLGIGFLACSSEPEKPENLIPEEKYVSLLVEMQLMRSYAENADTDSTTVDSLNNEIYKKYSISKEQFLQSHHYYQHFPEEQKERVDQAIEQLNMELVTNPDSLSKADTLRPSQNRP